VRPGAGGEATAVEAEGTGGGVVGATWVAGGGGPGSRRRQFTRQGKSLVVRAVTRDGMVVLARDVPMGYLLSSRGLLVLAPGPWNFMCLYMHADSISG
jgi:hypothetical protein